MKRIHFINYITLGGIINEVNVYKDLKVKAVTDSRTIAVIGQGKDGVKFVNDFSLFNIDLFLKTVQRFNPTEISEDEYQFIFTKPGSKLRWIKGGAGVANSVKNELDVNQFIYNSNIMISKKDKIRAFFDGLNEVLKYDIGGFVIFSERDDGMITIKLAENKYSNMYEQEIMKVNGEISPFSVRALKANVRDILTFLGQKVDEVTRVVLGQSIPFIITINNELLEVNYLVSNVIEVEE